MFREADESGVSEPVFESATTSIRASAPPVRLPSAIKPATAPPTARYGERRGFSPAAILLTILVHAIVIAGFMLVRTKYVKRQEAALVVLNVTPAPPPPADAPPTPMTKPAVVAPRALVDVPRPPVLPVAMLPDVQAAAPTRAPAAPSPAPPAPPAPPSVVQASDLGTKMIAGKPPRYPMDSRRKREQGTVVLSLTLGADGSVASIALAHSSGFESLDQAALVAVRKWRWEPTLRGGVPVMVKGIVEIPFVLQG